MTIDELAAANAAAKARWDAEKAAVTPTAAATALPPTVPSPSPFQPPRQPAPGSALYEMLTCGQLNPDPSAVAAAEQKRIQWEEHIRHQEAAERREAEARHRVKLFNLADVPPRYQLAGAAADASRLPDAEAQRWSMHFGLVRQGLHGSPSGAIIVLLGTRGAGKTHMACCLIRQWCDAGRTAKYVCARDYFNKLKATFNGPRNGPTVEDVQHEYATPRLLVLDELHERNAGAWESGELTALVRARYDNGLHTLLVTNETQADFHASIGDSIASRIEEGGGVVPCLWPDVRGHLKPPAAGSPLLNTTDETA